MAVCRKANCNLSVDGCKARGRVGVVDAERIPFSVPNIKERCRKILLLNVFYKMKGFEQGGSEAEENSPVDCFCRRG